MRRLKREPQIKKNGSKAAAEGVGIISERRKIRRIKFILVSLNFRLPRK